MLVKLGLFQVLNVRMWLSLGQGMPVNYVLLIFIFSIVVSLCLSLRDLNKICIMLRYCLWVLGNEKTLFRSDSIWKRLVSNARERRCFFNADEDKSLTEAMIDIKKELNQLDDLLNKDSILFRSARWKVCSLPFSIILLSLES